MKIITEKFHTFYNYNGKFYRISDHKNLCVNDIIIDGRDYSVKIIENEQDIIDMLYVAPELYVILEELTVRN